MNKTKTMIIVSGHGNSGKTKTIQEACKKLSAKATHVENLLVKGGGEDTIDYRYDILVVIEIEDIKIGIESQGDPGSRILGPNSTLYQLLKKNVDIVICASRRKGETIKQVIKIGQGYHMNLIKMSSLYAMNKQSMQTKLHDIGGNTIVEMVDSLINGTLA